jgi:uncharacterized protein
VSPSSRNPFVLSVRDLLHRPGEMREQNLDIALPEKWGEGLVSVAEGESLDLDLRLESVHEGILVTGEATSVATGVCGRCLIDIAQPVQIDFQELFAYPGEEANDVEVRDDHVDLEPTVRDAVVLSLPFQPVCRPDCPGLDPETGDRLADASVRDTPQATDPRWSALAGFPATEDAAGLPGTDDREG